MAQQRNCSTIMLIYFQTYLKSKSINNYLTSIKIVKLFPQKTNEKLVKLYNVFEKFEST